MRWTGAVRARAVRARAVRRGCSGGGCTSAPRAARPGRAAVPAGPPAPARHQPRPGRAVRDPVRGVRRGGRQVRCEDGVDVASDVVGGVLVHGGDEDPAGPQDPGRLGDHFRDDAGLPQQVQQPHRAHRVQGPGAHRQPGPGGEEHRDPAAARRRGHPVRGVRAQDPQSGPGQPGGDDAGAAAEVQERADLRGEQAEDRRGGGLGARGAATGGVVGRGLRVVVEQGSRYRGARRHQLAPCAGARASTRSARAKSASVTAPPASWVFTDRRTVW